MLTSILLDKRTARDASRETELLMETKVGILRQLGPVVGALAWASPIRLSGRGMETPAARRRSRSAYHRDGADQSLRVLKHARAPAAHPAPRYVAVGGIATV